MNIAGRHIIADIWCELLPEPDRLRAGCVEAINASGMRIVTQAHIEFEPQGMTAVWILAESHMTLHTFPEHGYCSIDVYTCGDEGDPLAAVYQLLARMKPVKVAMRFLSRGEQPWESMELRR